MGLDSTNARAVRRARDSEERAVDDGGRGSVFGGLGESGTDANGARRRSPAQEEIMMITVSYIRTSGKHPNTIPSSITLSTQAA